MSINKLMPGEFEFIERMRSRYHLRHVGDDCAVLPKDDLYDTVITADLLVEDIDFRLEWATPVQIGHKALAVSLSDIAAMGATPKWAMLSIGLPSELWKTEFADAFYEGWQRLAARFGVEMIGGDVSRTPDKIVIDSIAGGEVSNGKAVLRSGAKAGEAIYVSGPLGGAAGGLKLLSKGQLDGPLPLTHLEPLPHIIIGKQLSTHEIASAMIDISDGLSSDLGHLCKASNVGARIRRDLLPIDENLSQFFPETECLDLALNGGEDFVLLFTGAKELRLPGTTYIGDVTENRGSIELVDGARTSLLEPAGFRHF